MAVLEVKVPQLSESVTEATLLQWHKKAGDAVALDENLVDIETDKVVLELPSPAAGVLASVLKKDGDTVVAGEVIATVDTVAVAVAAEKDPFVQADGVKTFAAVPETAVSRAVAMPCRHAGSAKTVETPVIPLHSTANGTCRSGRLSFRHRHAGGCPDDCRAGYG